MQSAALRSDVLAKSSPALRGLLMVVLAFVYSSNYNCSSHCVSAAQLVQHLQRLDPNSTKASRERLFGVGEWNVVLEVFVKQHYLTKEREEGGEGTVDVMGLGPRAFLEVGRRQVLCFTHEAVDLAVDQSLLDELEEDDKADDDDYEEGEGA